MKVDKIQLINDMFYRAFESLNVTEMSKVWVKDEASQVIHPGWPVKQGWKEVEDSWRAIFNNTSYMEFTLTDITISDMGSWARVTCVENLRSVAGGQESNGRVMATNLYLLKEEEWLMMHHHGSALPIR